MKISFDYFFLSIKEVIYGKYYFDKIMSKLLSATIS